MTDDWNPMTDADYGDGIKVVLSNEEASSKPFELLPKGNYKVTVSDVALKESKSAKNPGKPFYSMELTITEGKYEGRKLFANVMLWQGAGFTLGQLLQAAGISEGQGGEVVVPGPEWWISKCPDMIAVVRIQRERTVSDPATGEKKTYDERNEVSGFKKVEAGVATAAAGNSLLPS